MSQEIRKPAGLGQAFKDYRGDDPNPQENHEAFSHKCQGNNYNSVHLLADLLDKHLELRAEVALLRAENARLMRLIAGRGV